MALMGVLPAVAVAVGVGILNYYTLWLLIVLYLERKRIMVAPRHLFFEHYIDDLSAVCQIATGCFAEHCFDEQPVALECLD